MNIGVIVYSQTGNTLAVAERMKETLIAAGHTAEIEQITVESAGGSDAPVKLTNAPDPAKYDAVIFGAPVQAFSLCRQMTAYLKQMPVIKGKPVGSFLTQGLPKKWMGGNRACRSLRKLCMAKGADPIEVGHVHWKSDQRDALIAATVSGAVKFAATVQ